MASRADGGITLDALAVLDAIAHEGSFAAAAARVHRVPSAVSYAVNTLERRLGVRLFERTRDGAVLTAAGRQLLYEGREILHRVEQAAQRVRIAEAVATHSFVVGVDDLVPLDMVVASVRECVRGESAPAPRVELECFDADDVGHALAAGRITVAVGLLSRQSRRADIDCATVAYLPVVLVVPPEHVLATHPEPVPATRIAAGELILHAAMSELPGGIAEQGAIAVGSRMQVIRAVQRGLGVGLLPHATFGAAPQGVGLVLKEVAGLPAPPLHVAWLKHGRSDMAVAFCRSLATRVRSGHGLIESEGGP